MATGVRRAYLRIADELRARIRNGVLKPGEMLPSEAAISAEFGVARGTARQALAVLEEEGLVSIVSGRGRVVRSSSRPDAYTGAQYQRIAGELRQAILGGELRPGDPLPSEAAIVRENGVSRGTARQALSLLVNEGYAVSRQGRGRIVSSPDPDATRRVDP